MNWRWHMRVCRAWKPLTGCQVLTEHILVHTPLLRWDILVSVWRGRLCGVSRDNVNTGCDIWERRYSVKLICGPACRIIMTRPLPSSERCACSGSEYSRDLPRLYRTTAVWFNLRLCSLIGHRAEGILAVRGAMPVLRSMSPELSCPLQSSFDSPRKRMPTLQHSWRYISRRIEVVCPYRNLLCGKLGCLSAEKTTNKIILRGL
jgi:hypothetical protein